MSAQPSSEPQRSFLELAPWLVPLTDEVVICKDGGLLASYEFVAGDLDGAEEALRVELAAAVDRFGEAIRDRPITLWWTVRRERNETYPVGNFSNPIAAFLDNEHRANILGSAAYRNRHFLSVLWMPDASAGSIPDKISALIADGVSPIKAMITGIKAGFGSRSAYAFRAAEIDQELRDFEGILPRLEATLYPTQPRRLAGDELLGFLWSLANPGLPMAPKRWDGQSLIDAALAERPLTVNRDTLRFGDGEDATYAAAISLRTPPAATQWAAFEGLLSYPGEMILSQIFRVASTSDVTKHADALRRTLNISKITPKGLLSAIINKGEVGATNVDESKARDAMEAEGAKQLALGGSVVFGWYNLTALLLDSDLDGLEEGVKSVLRSFHAGAFAGAIRESIHLTSSYSSVLPGSWAHCHRWLMLSHQNCTDLAPLTGVSDGELVNDHLTRQLGERCEALITFETEYRTPYFFNFHAGALGHTAVIGPSRSGKSIGMNFAISQWAKYPGSRAVIFDKDSSCRIPSILQGGKHIHLRPDAKVRMNPLVLLKDRAHWPFVQRWVEGLAETRGYKMTVEDDTRLRDALQDLAGRENQSLLSLGYLVELLDTHLRAVLSPWVSEGQYAAYFDNVEDDFNLSAQLTCIEMNEIMREPAAARAFLDYAFYRLQLLLQSAKRDGAFPTLVYIEEAWFLMQDEAFTKRLMDWLKTFAKLNAIVVLTTQSLEDLAALPPQVFASVRDNIPTRLFLPNAMATSETAYPVYRHKFGLSDVQIQKLAHATPREDYLIVKPGVSRLGKLRLNPRQVAVLRSDNAAQRMFDRFYNPDVPASEWGPAYIDALLESNA